MEAEIKKKPAEKTVKNSKIYGHIYEIQNECKVGSDNLKTHNYQQSEIVGFSPSQSMYA